MTDRMAAPTPRNRRARQDWTRPESYLARKAMFFAPPSMDEPRRTSSRPRFPVPATLAPSGAQPTSSIKPWRPSRLIPPFLALFLVALLWISVGKAAMSPAQSVRSPVRPAPATTGIRAAFGICLSPEDRNCVHDGASFRYDDVDYKLAGIAAPSKAEPACTAERQLGRLSAERLRGLLSNGSMSLVPLRRNGAPDSAPVHRVSVDGRDIASLLLAEGHVQPLAYGTPRWCT